MRKILLIGGSLLIACPSTVWAQDVLSFRVYTSPDAAAPNENVWSATCPTGKVISGTCIVLNQGVAPSLQNAGIKPSIDPNNSGAWQCVWNPVGTVTQARVNALCLVIK